MENWIATLKKLTWSPFPGMAPVEDADQLIGRDEDREALLYKVMNKSLVVLHGNSGTGKTSLVQAGLVDTLREEGYTTLICRQWRGLDDSEETQAFLWERFSSDDSGLGASPSLNKSTIERLAQQEDDPSVLDQLLAPADAEDPLPGVIILDQFEEALRDYPDAAQAVINFIGEVIERPVSDCRFVISLRSDSLHLLNPLLRRGFRAHRVEEAEILPIRTEFIPAVLETQIEGGSSSSLEFAKELSDTILATWSSLSDPRLDGLQALLSAIYFQVRESASRTDDGLPDDGQFRADLSTLGNVQELAKRYAGQAGARPRGPESEPTDSLELSPDQTMDPQIFEDGVKAYVHFMMKFADDATKEAGIDSYLRHGTREMVARSIEYLWSDGFKVPTDASNLVARILKPEILMLSSVGEHSRDDLRRMAIDLAIELLEMVDPVGARHTSSSREQPDRKGDVFAQNETTAGPLLGRPPSSALVEEVRRAVFALHWLTHTDFAKRSGPARSRRITLVHDGSGFGLEPWSRAIVGGFDYDAHRLTAARGERLVFPKLRDSAEHHEQFDQIGWAVTPRTPEDTVAEGTGAAQATRVVPNLNWRDCRISGTFEDLIFLNCDFSGSRFEGCEMSRVTFANCLLDDADFEDCTIIGFNEVEFQKRRSMPGFTLGSVRQAPSFTVGVDKEMTTAFGPYLGGLSDEDSGLFFSECVGVPAMPGGAPQDLEALSLELPFISGGLAFVGGRISFLTFHSCQGSPDSENPATIDFCYPGGGGLDIVEPEGVLYRFRDCAVRGISVTRDEPAASQDVAKINFSADDSFIVFLYFSSGLSGEAKVTDCNVWGAINSSETLKMSMSGSRFQFVVNGDDTDTGDEDSSLGKRSSVDDGVTPAYFRAEEDYASVFTADPARLAHQLELMDFRRSPEVRERQQRARGREESASTQRRDERERGEE